MVRRSASVVWTEYDDVLEKGGTPLIELSPVTRVEEPKRKRGRPRVRKSGAKAREHYASFTPSGHRMRCRANGCTKRLKRDQVLVCSDQCFAQLVESCELYLAILRGEIPKDELPVYMRTNRVRRGAKITL